MTEWGISNFENESASGFLNDLDMNGYGLINVVLDRILEEDAELSVTDCEEALVAAEIVAAVCGKPSEELPDEISDWIAGNLPPGSEEYETILASAEKAADAIDRIVTNSELKELWEEHEGFDDWFERQIALQNRLLD